MKKYRWITLIKFHQKFRILIFTVSDLFDLRPNSLFCIRILRALGLTAMNFRWCRGNRYVAFIRDFTCDNGKNY